MKLNWRPISTGDIPAYARLLAASERVDDTGEHLDEDDIAEELADPKLDLERHTTGVWDGDRMVAFAVVQGRSEALDVHRIYVWGAVDPAHRRTGLGRRVIEWAAEVAAKAHGEEHPDLPGEIHVRAYALNVGQIALLASTGFEPMRWWFTMARDLSQPVDPVAPPTGLRLEAFDFEHDEATRRARNDAFADHWGATPRDAETWRHWFTGSRAFRPAQSFLLLDDARAPDPVAAFVLTYEFEAEAAVTGVREAWLGQIGTRRPYRGRGAGSALLARALAAYQEAGFDRSALDVDSANPTGALGIYERAGYAVERRWVSYARTLP
ncbi:MAG: GNAT family N-acetyltransferase [Acidimicrobiales bacterium]